MQTNQEIVRFRLGLRILLVSAFLIFYGAIELYAAVSGQQLWVRRHNSSLNKSDEALAIAIDSNNNIYVTGSSASDYSTIKYNSAGTRKWIRHYNGPANKIDKATDIAIDSNNNIVVTGTSPDSLEVDEFATIKYDSAGNKKWLKRYKGTTKGPDEPRAIAIGKNNSIYVTGSSASDYATIKYDSSGNQKWIKSYNGTDGRNDVATAIAVDANGNIFVTGRSARSQYYTNDIVTIKYSPLGVRKWVKKYTSSGARFDAGNDIAIDKIGNIYVVGVTQDDYFITIKYDNAGNQLWLKKYRRSVYSTGWADFVAVDANENVYVAGTSSGPSYFDYSIIKYNSAGDQKWVRFYSSSGFSEDNLSAMCLDSNGNVFVTGASEGASYYNDYATVKYDSSGNKKWVKRYNGLSGSVDVANDIAVDGNDNIYVTGTSYGGSTPRYDYLTIKYSH